MSDRDREILDMYFQNNLIDQVDIDYFNSRLNDKDFKSIYEEETEIVKALENYDSARLKNRLEDLETNIKNKKKSNKNILLLLALLVSALLAWYIFSKSNNKNETSNLYAEFYTPYPNIIDPLTKGDRDTLSVFQNYEKGDFKKVLNELEGKMDISEEKLFYLAMTHLELKNYDKADKTLSKVNKESFISDRDWYRVLICLKLNKVGCKEKLKALSINSNNPYSKKAGNLLEKYGD